MAHIANPATQGQGGDNPGYDGALQGSSKSITVGILSANIRCAIYHISILFLYSYSFIFFTKIPNNLEFIGGKCIIKI